MSFRGRCVWLLHVQAPEHAIQKCPCHILQWISSKLELHINFALFAFQLWRVVHAQLYKTSVSIIGCMFTYQHSDINSHIVIFGCYFFGSSKDLGNSEPDSSKDSSLYMNLGCICMHKIVDMHTDLHYSISAIALFPGSPSPLQFYTYA